MPQNYPHRSFKKIISSALSGGVCLLVLALLSAYLWSDKRTESRQAIDPTSQGPARMPARFEDELFTSASKENEKTLAKEAINKTGVRAIRARKVRFNSEPLRVTKRPGDRLVRFQLFADTVFVVRFMEASPQLNRRAELVGQVEGDPDSRVQLWATKNAISGELSTAGRTFRFVPITGGFHYIIEVDPSR